MRFLTRLWPFRGGDVTTAVTDDDFVSVPPRPFRLISLLTAPKHPFALVPQPIAFSEREPAKHDRDMDCDQSFWGGKWLDRKWIWRRCWTCGAAISSGYTHWLPASVEVLPVRCCPPKLQP